METTTEICARCGADTTAPSETCGACGKDPRLVGGATSGAVAARPSTAYYRLVRRLGHGAVGTTYAALRESDGQPVAVKELLVRRLEDFKAHDLFTREAAVLRTLEHPAIPRYHDDFAFGEGRHTGLYLVTELIDGVTLADEMKSRRHSQREVLAVVRELCDVLGYLHGLAPPVVHRDLKASNVMRRHADQRLVLIDFGAVKDSVRQPGDGSTVAGTFGYMPPEQLAGRASPASDVYALGVLCVVLLTRRSAHELLDDQNRLQWREHVSGEPLRQLLAAMLEPDPSRRLGDVAEVARRIDDVLAGRAPARDMAGAVTGGATFGRKAELLGHRFGGRFGKMAERVQQLIADSVTSSAPGEAEPPPPTPREIPSGFAGRAEPVANFMRIFGVLFGGIPFIMAGAMFDLGGPSFMFLMFFLAGAALATYGFVRVGRAKRLFKRGEAAPAVVTDAWLNTGVRVNGRSPFKITFRYETPDGQVHESTVSRFRTRPDLRVPGAKVYALYDPESPSRATLWPL